MSAHTREIVRRKLSSLDVALRDEIVQIRNETVQRFANLLDTYIAGKMREQNIKPMPQLSAREQQVYALAMVGKMNKEIADELNIATRTVKFHMSSILSKLKVASRPEMFRREGIQ